MLAIIIVNPILKVTDLVPALAASRNPRAGEGILVPALRCEDRVASHTSALSRGYWQVQGTAALLHDPIAPHQLRRVKGCTIINQFH